jgi:hypothetical protein
MTLLLAGQLMHASLHAKKLPTFALAGHLLNAAPPLFGLTI